MIDYIGVGGSGGHCAPQYFNLIEIPNFPEEVQEEIAKLYFNKPETPEIGPKDIDEIISKDIEWSQNAGIIELDTSIKSLKKHLNHVIDQIISDKNIKIDMAQFFS
jgi:hypothetical protein